MGEPWPEPGEGDSIDCHLQQQGMGSLVCRAAQTGREHSTNEVEPAVCFKCPTGKVYREVGCDAVTTKMHLSRLLDGNLTVRFDELFCKRKRRATSLEACSTCNLVSAETTRATTSLAKGLFEAEGFFSAYKDIEKAREALRDGNFENAVTRSIACLESTLVIAHEKLSAPLPSKRALSDLWRSGRTILRIEELDGSNSVEALLSSMAGVVQHVGALRNALGDAHGRGLQPPRVSALVAELALNAASTMATAVVRRLRQMEAKDAD